MARRAANARSASPDQVMTVDQVAAYLQLNRLTVYRYIREGQIPAARIGKLYRVLKPDVDRFLEGRKVGPDSPASIRRRHGPGAAQPQVHAKGPPQVWGARDSSEAYVGPQWRDQLKEREARELARLTGFPLEWVMRGLH